MHGLSTFLLVGLYLYGAFAFGRAEARAGAPVGTIVMKAAIWPVTAFNTLKKLHDAPPEL